MEKPDDRGPVGASDLRVVSAHRPAWNQGMALRAGLIIMVLLLSAYTASAQGTDSLWHDFTTALLRGEITADRLRPYHPSLAEPMLRYLEAFRTGTTPAEWERRPEAHRVGDLVHYIMPFAKGADTSVFCFTLRIEDGRWYFAQLENIFIRLDTLSGLPASTFPDLPEPRKAWMREEKYWSFIVYLYNELRKEKGAEYALNLLKDGEGYFLEAKAWVPFVAPRRAFVLYCCWEQAVLRGNRVTLGELGDSLAKISMTPIYFQLYKQTAHLAGQISREEYTSIFETIWQDRARAAGWTLEIGYPTDEECIFTLR